MALREKLEERVTPLLAPGEKVEAVFVAQTGPIPYLQVLMGPLLMLSVVKRRIVAVTDRNVVVLKAGRVSGTTAREVMSRLPRATRIGPLTGLWARTELGGERLWVHKRFHKDVERADASS